MTTFAPPPGLAGEGTAAAQVEPDGPGGAGAPRRRRLRRWEPVLWGGGSVAVFLVAWQLVAGAQLVPPLFLPAPTEIAQAMAQMFQDPTIWIDLETSGQEFLLGYALAIAIGLPLGLLTGRYRRLAWSLDPFIAFFYSMPRIALVPLLIIWFGIGVYSKVAVVFLGAFFPITISTMAGIRSLDPALLRAAQSFGATELQVFRTIALPGSVPFILTGLRLGVGHALVGVVVGELVAAQHGIAQRMSVAGTTFQVPTMFAALVVISGTGVVLTMILQRIERRFDAWRPRPA